MALLADVLLGIYIGVLTGAFAAIIVYLLTFLFTYLAGAKLSINYALLIGLGIAGLAGGPRLLLRNPEILQSATSLVMLVFVLFLSFFAHQRATDLGEALPSPSVVLRKLRPRSLSAGVIRQVGRYGQVTIRPRGEIGDLEGYPPVSNETRTAIRADRWHFPADIPLAELERRLEDRLRVDHDLADADVAIDPSGRATIRVAPTMGGLSRRVEPGSQVLSVETVLPAGIAAGDDVVLELSDRRVIGRVVEVAAASAEESEEADADGEDDAASVREEEGIRTPGGEGRVAVAVDSAEVETVVDDDVDRLYVRSSGQLPVFEFISRLRGDDLHFRKLTVGPDSPLIGATLAEAPGTGEAVIIALRHGDRWRFAPERSATLSAMDEIYVSGARADLDAVREAIA